MANRQPLVSQFLENVSGTALEEYQKVIRDYVRKRSGVYALYRRDRLYYVGLASNLKNRLGHHLRDKHRGKWDRFSVYLTIGDSHLKELESLVLRIAQPKGNTQGGKFSSAENLRKTLARDMRAFYRRQLDAMLGKINRDLAKDPSRAGPSHPPVLARYVPKLRRPRKLLAIFRGTKYRARIRPDGSISYRKKTYRSPSLAGRAVTRRPTNGWTFWLYERAPKDWVKLKELRR